MVSFLITLLSPLIFCLIFSILSKFRNIHSKNCRPLPPGPPGLPIIGNLHELDLSNLSDHLWRLSKCYGPLMSLRLGFVQTLVVSSAEMAKEVLKTKDLIFCNRPVLTGQQKLSYNNRDIAFSPYNEYWRQMRKTCTLHLFSMKQVDSFRYIREEEVFEMIDSLKTQISTKRVVNLSEILMILTGNIISRMAFGKRVGTSTYDDENNETTRFHELLLQCQVSFTNFYYRDLFPLMGWLDKLNGSIGKLEKIFKDMDELYQELIDEHLNQNKQNKMQEDMVDILLKLKEENSDSYLTFEHIKAVLMNILLGGTETSATTVVWAMTLLMKNPQSLKIVQQEVRNVVGNKGRVHEDDLDKLDYLKAVIKETLRLQPVAPLLVTHESRDRCVLDKFEIPKKTLVYVNVWAIGRDPNCWERAEEFDPERFIGNSIDYKGLDFEFIPFGSGRRGCPGMSLGATTVEVALANLVYAFDWEIPDGMKDIDTLATTGTVSHKKRSLRLVAKVVDYGVDLGSRHSFLVSVIYQENRAAMYKEDGNSIHQSSDNKPDKTFRIRSYLEILSQQTLEATSNDIPAKGVASQPSVIVAGKITTVPSKVDTANNKSSSSSEQSTRGNSKPKFLSHIRVRVKPSSPIFTNVFIQTTKKGKSKDCNPSSSSQLKTSTKEKGNIPNFSHISPEKGWSDDHNPKYRIKHGMKTSSTINSRSKVQQSIKVKKENPN
ncbi:6,7,8-trihydroxycoumarin synthase-like [Rutidosis leptorrhynchoides]|uniref:6,7,8-trihydroxycoumarin synthase-like n=1 Tax=Rutidosis leptorrhynchoides TaxID=125765 RepID=UPI003A998FEE